MSTAPVTVVIPTKDRLEVLRRTLRAVLAQDAVELHVVVVDDGGSDQLQSTLSGLDRVKVLRHPQSLGVARARNTGLEVAATPWIAFVDDDDLWSPGKLRRQLEALDADPDCRWACSSSVEFFEDGRVTVIQDAPTARDVATAVLERNVVPGGGSGVLVATELLREVSGFAEDLSTLADWECWMRLAQRTPLAVVQRVDVAHRQHSGNMSNDVAAAQAELDEILARHDHLYEEHGARLDEAAWRFYLLQRTWAGRQWRSGLRESWRLHRDHGHARALLQPLAAVVPGLQRRRQSRVQRRHDPVRYDAAASWVAQVLQPPSAPDVPAASRSTAGAP